MNIQQQPHSCVRREGRDYVEIPRPITTGTRMKELSITFNSSPTVANNWFIPLYNLLDIPQGQTAQSRTGNSILIHRIEFEYVYRANPSAVVLPETMTNDQTNAQLQNPAMRILVTQPKSMYRVAPVSSGLPTLSYPYYNATGDGYHPEPLPPPISIGADSMNGVLGLPDPKKHDLEYDDVRNLYQDSVVPFSTGSFTFVIRKRFDYDQDRYNNIGQIYFTDSEVFNSIPQMWFFTPNQVHTSGNNLYTFNFTGYMRIIFDNVT